MRRIPFTLAVMVSLATPFIVTAQTTPTLLEINEPISRQLAGGNRDVFQVKLRRDNFFIFR